MSKAHQISRERAQQLVLQAQGLDGVSRPSLEIIKRLSYVQIDSIAVTARAHHHVIFSRNLDYQQTDLEPLMQQGEVFEYWSHAAAILPMQDYRFSLFTKGKILKEEKFWFEKDKKLMRQVIRRLKKEGPLQSKDFVHKATNAGTWYEWKPAKVALHQLFMEGRIMICSRQGFQKVYDLTERVLPEGTDTRKPTEKGFYTYLTDRAISAQGLATAPEIGYLRKGSKEPIARILKEKLRKKELVKVTVEGLEAVYYARPESLDEPATEANQNELYILNPFDNLVIQRNRLWDLFHFDYLIECYVPGPKRKWGYYTLPVLYQGQFVARLDARADRENDRLIVKQVWLEEGFKPDADFIEAFVTHLRSFARFCGCSHLDGSSVADATIKRVLL